MTKPTSPPPDAVATATIVAVSESMLDTEPARMSAARDAMALLRNRMAVDGAEPEALELLCRHIRKIDAHLRRRSQAHLKLVPHDVEQVE